MNDFMMDRTSNLIGPFTEDNLDKEEKTRILIDITIRGAQSFIYPPHGRHAINLRHGLHDNESANPSSSPTKSTLTMELYQGLFIYPPSSHLSIPPHRSISPPLSCGVADIIGANPSPSPTKGPTDPFNQSLMTLYIVPRSHLRNLFAAPPCTPRPRWGMWGLRRRRVECRVPDRVETRRIMGLEMGI